MASDNLDWRICRGIYLLLNKYHRMYGLEIYLFGGPGHASGYVGFQVAGNPSSDVNYGFVGRGHEDETFCGPLVAYLPANLAGIPNWATAGATVPEAQLHMPDDDLKRSYRVYRWLDENLGLQKLFVRDVDAISDWRATCTVEQAEKYLLMVGLAWRLARHAGSYFKTPAQMNYHGTVTLEVERQLATLGGVANDDVLGVAGILVARNGMALVDSTPVNVWELRTAGRSTRDIVAKLLRIRNTGA